MKILNFLGLKPNFCVSRKVLCHVSGRLSVEIDGKKMSEVRRTSPEVRFHLNFFRISYSEDELSDESMSPS